jgi:nucleotide-binding universal stress UspA family protein
MSTAEPARHAHPSIRKGEDMFKHILVPTDGSDLSQAAALQAVKLAKSLGARVTAYFAAPPATPSTWV